MSLANCETSHNILWDKIFFNLTLTSVSVSTTSGTSNLSEGFGRENIKPIKSYVIVYQKFNNPKTFILWHDILGQFGSPIICRIIKHSHGHPLKN